MGKIIFATGPKVSELTREAALAAAKESPRFPKDADAIAIEELDGHWVAAVHVADNPFGGPADESDDAPGPKSEGPGDTKPDDGGEPPKDDGGSDDGSSDDGEGGPPKHDEKGEGGEIKIEHHILDLLTKIVTALGIPLDEGVSPVPGEEAPPGPPPGPPGGPPGAGGPPGPDQEVKHERALKPGEVPPGATPVGAPAFSSTNPIIARGEKHPWESLIGVAATFEVEERVPDHYGATEVDEELSEVAKDTGFKVKQTKVYTDENGHRIAKALISAY
jgi:hypothetical protein